MRYALLVALALLAGIATEALPFTERSPLPSVGKGGCDCTPRCICGCRQGKPCSCEIYPGPRPYPQFPAAGECESCRAEAWAAADEIGEAQGQEPYYNEMLGALAAYRYDVERTWEMARDLQHPDSTRERREHVAGELAGRIGVEAFTNGWLPPPR